MNLKSLVERRRDSLPELEARMSSPEFYADAKTAALVMREHRQITKLCEDWDEYERMLQQLAESESLAKGEDEEFAALAELEIPVLEEKIQSLIEKIKFSLLPPDPSEAKDAIIEIRAGTGGDEASLFAGDLFRMYCRNSETRGWRIELLESSPSGVGGFKEVVFKVSGEEVFRHLRYESGVHRVQRVPTTEAQGRIHTSTATVAVLPEAGEVDVELRPDDVRVEVCRASGAGGQGVNTTDSAVQVMHIPTGLIVRCQDGRSQIKNKEKALTILRSRLYEIKQREEAEKYSAHRKSLIGSGGREEKIRTYNFPQNRVTDHRIGLTLYNLEEVIHGEINPLVEALQASEMSERLKEAGIVEA